MHPMLSGQPEPRLRPPDRARARSGGRVPGRPVAWGVLATRLALLVAGLFLFAYGITMTLGSGLGLSPWDALHQGLSRHTPLSFGQASIAVGGVIILGSALLRVRPGLGTVCNMVLIGACIDLLAAMHLTLDARQAPVLLRIALHLAGVAVVGLGSALYLKAALGAGPRDSLMLALSRLLGVRVGIVRALIESSALALGFLLGGTIGVGTLLFALGIGPAVDLAFRLLRVSSPHQAPCD